MSTDTVDRGQVAVAGLSVGDDMLSVRSNAAMYPVHVRHSTKRPKRTTIESRTTRWRRYCVLTGMLGAVPRDDLGRLGARVDDGVFRHAQQP